MLCILRDICAFQGSGASGRLASLSMEELRYHAVGRALLTKEESLVTPCDELEELLESFAYGITYEPTSMPLHPYTEPPFTISDVGLSFFEFLLLLEITLLTFLSFPLSACGKT